MFVTIYNPWDTSALHLWLSRLDIACMEDGGLGRPLLDISVFYDYIVKNKV